MENKENKSVRQKNAKPDVSTQLHLPIASIHDDTVILKNGGIRTIIETNAVNFNLKSEEEQNAIIFSYQNFLNTLDFPTQILVKSQRLDIDSYIEKLSKLAENQSNKLIKKQTYDYIEYIQRLVEYAYIMEKKFYVVIPYDPLRSRDLNFFQKFFARLKKRDQVSDIKTRDKEFAEIKKYLVQRTNMVKNQLENIGLKVKILENPELIKLLHDSYNLKSARNQKISDLDKVQMTNDNAI